MSKDELECLQKLAEERYAVAEIAWGDCDWTSEMLQAVAQACAVFVIASINEKIGNPDKN